MANEKRPIDANRFIKHFEKAKAIAQKIPGELGSFLCDLYEECIEEIGKQPTVDAVEVVHGRWEDVKETSLYVPDMKYTVTHTAETCSVCKVRIGFIGSKPYLYDNICPNCGAKMDGERKDNG